MAGGISPPTAHKDHQKHPQQYTLLDELSIFTENHDFLKPFVLETLKSYSIVNVTVSFLVKFW